MKNNKVCIVTGASRGLGRGIALVLAQEEGCTVYATARNEEALKALAEEAAAGTKGGVVRVYIGLNDLKTQKTFQSPSLQRRICSWKKS